MKFVQGLAAVLLASSCMATPAASASHTLKADDTYTYVRCWYRTGHSHNDVASDWEWARDKDNNYYTIDGHWWSSGVTQWKNMFYTSTPQKEIEQRCRETLDLDNPNADILYYAADNRFSFNYTIWSHDSSMAPGKINKVIAFGDSISDTNNMFNASQWRFPSPYGWYMGHFSNGFVWTEYLAQSKQIPLYNWAVGGAAGNDQYLMLTGIHSQIDSYEEYIKYARNYNPNNTLYTLEFGLNDFMNYGRSVSDVTADYGRALQRLENLGAKNLILMTLPDASKIPQLKYGTAEKRAEMQQQILAFNQFTREQVKIYKARGMNIMLFDAYQIFEQLTSNPQSLGFVNSSDSCMDINRSSSMDYLYSHSLRNDCAYHGSDKYVFWGITHPTTAVHKLLSDKVISAMKDQFNF